MGYGVRSPAVVKRGTPLSESSATTPSGSLMGSGLGRCGTDWIVAKPPGEGGEERKGGGMDRGGWKAQSTVRSEH